MDQNGFVSNIFQATIAIDSGRKGFATRGKAEEGRISYEDGITKAMSTFQGAQAFADPQIMMLVEFTFITQELHFCEKTDKDALSSLTKAIQSFDDAFLAIQAVEDPRYLITDNAFPHKGTYRIKGFPLDSFHIACNGHTTRLKNILRSPGIDMIEEMLLRERLSNLSTAQYSYIEKQKKAMEAKLL